MLKTLVRAGRHAEASQSILDGLADDDLEQLTAVPGPMEHFTIARRLAIDPLRRLDQRRQANALRRWIATAGVRLPNESRLLEIIHQLVDRNGSSGVVGRNVFTPFVPFIIPEKPFMEPIHVAKMVHRHPSFSIFVQGHKTLVTCLTPNRIDHAL